MFHNNHHHQQQQQNTEINATQSMEVNDYDGFDYQQASIFAGAIENFKSLTPSSSQSSGYRLNFANGNSGSSQERYLHRQLAMSSGSQVSPLSQQTEIERRIEEFNNHLNFSESSTNYTSDNNNNTNSTASLNYYYQNDNDENQDHYMSPATLASSPSSPCPSVDVRDRVADLTCGHQHQSDFDVSAQPLKSRNSDNKDVASLIPAFLQYLFDAGKGHQQEPSSQQQHKRRQPLGNQAVLINRWPSHDLNAIHYHHHQSSSSLSSGIASFSSSPSDTKPGCKIGLLVTVNLDPNGELSLDGCSIVKSDEMRGDDKVLSMPVVSSDHQNSERTNNIPQQECDIKPTVERLLEKHQKRKSTPRVKKTASQVRLLEAALEESNYPNQYQRESLAKKTGLSDGQIRLWFQYKRNKVTRAAAAKTKASKRKM